MGGVAGPFPDSLTVDPAAAGAREIADGVWRLRLPWSWIGVDHVNAYLLTDGRDHALVDCGPAGHPTNLAGLEHALAGTGVAPEQIGTLLLTHTHSDHMGQGHELVRRAGTAVWRHPDSAHVDDVMTDPARLAAARVRRARAEGVPEEKLPLFADVREETDTIVEPLPADHLLVPGEQVPSPVGPLDVVGAPGHAPSQVALVARDRGLVFVGDAVCAVFSPYYDYGFSDDPVGEQLSTLDRLDALGGLVALPGHGRPLEDLGAVVAAYRGATAAELDAVRAGVAEGPAGAYEVGVRAFGVQPTGFGLFLRTVLAAGYLRHLRLRGEVVRRERPDGLLEHSVVG